MPRIAPGDSPISSRLELRMPKWQAKIAARGLTRQWTPPDDSNALSRCELEHSDLRQLDTLHLPAAVFKAQLPANCVHPEPVNDT